MKGAEAMDQFDADLEQRVWERVNGARQDRRSDEDIQHMMALAAESAAVYRQLAAKSTGRQREQLLRLSEGEQEAFGCLRGMAIMDGSEGMQIGAYGMGNQPRRRALAGCVRRCMDNYRNFASRTAQPDYGMVYQQLASRQAERLARTLELMGEKG